MGELTRRTILRIATAELVGVVVGASAANCLAADKKEDDRPAKLIQTMEGFRTKIPPAANDPNEQEGMALGDYVTPHLRGVARRLGIKTRAECLVLLTYLKDENVVLRYIAKSAISDLLNAFPAGTSIDAVLKTQSKDHETLVLRFVQLIEKMPA